MFPLSNRSSRSSSTHSLPILLGKNEPPAYVNVDTYVNESFRWEDDVSDFSGDCASPECSDNENRNFSECAHLDNESFDSLGVLLTPEISEDDSLNPGIQLAFAHTNSMAQIFLSLMKDMISIAKTTPLSKMESDLNDMCAHFYNATRLSKTDTECKIKNSAKKFKDHLIEKDFHNYLLNKPIDPPKYFSPIPTLLSRHKRKEALKYFPTSQPKFSGLPCWNNNMDIFDFLFAFKTAQEHCKLSEKEFKEFLKLCTKGKAHFLVKEWTNLEETIPTIFHGLLMHFDKEASKELLFAYKAPCNLSLTQVETNIMLWVSRASALLPSGPARKAYYNKEVIKTMIRCLPPMSSVRVQSIFNTLSTHLGRAAVATEFSRALNVHRHLIDTDIQRNGVPKNSTKALTEENVCRATSYAASIPTPQRPINTKNCKNNKKIYSNIYNGNKPTNTKVYNSIATPFPFRNHTRPVGSHNKHHAHDRFLNNRPIAPNGAQMRSNSYRENFKSNSNKHHSSNKRKTCSLCGKHDHIASQGCPHMVLDSGLKIRNHTYASILHLIPNKGKP